MTDQPRDIWKERLTLDRERRDKISELIGDWERDYYYPKRKELQDICEAQGGHKWEFSNLGPLGDPWFHCRRCGKARVELQGDIDDGA